MEKFGKFGLLVAPYEALPRTYGFAYYKMDMDYSVCYPIPLNLVVGLWHWLHFKMRCGFLRSSLVREQNRWKQIGIEEERQRISHELEKLT